MTDTWDDDEPEVHWGLERELIDTSTVVEFIIVGDPASKARARFTKRGSKVHTYTPAATHDAEMNVAAVAQAAGAGPEDATSSFGILAVFFTATWQRRDVDNMLKLLSDGLTGVVWQDDSQVTEMSARVVRCDPDPRTHVRIYRTMSQGPETKPCPVCRKPVRSYKSVKYRTCSAECSRIAMRPIAWSCATCGKTEMRTPYQAKAKYCSQACTSNRRITFCMQCGELVDKPASQRAGATTFCSRACVYIWRTGRPRGATS